MKLPLVSSRDMIKFLTEKGFQVTSCKGDHAILRKGSKRTEIPLRKKLTKDNIMHRLQDCGIEKTDLIKWYK